MLLAFVAVLYMYVFLLYLHPKYMYIVHILCKSPQKSKYEEMGVVVVVVALRFI